MQARTGISDNIYAGAGSAIKSDNVYAGAGGVGKSDDVYAGAEQRVGGGRGGAGKSDNVYSGAGRGSSDNIYAGVERGRGGGASDNVYAGAGRGAGSMAPSPSVAYEPPMQVPTPQLEFERRLAENPIVPSGGKLIYVVKSISLALASLFLIIVFIKAFGGSKPTAHFFGRNNAPPTGASSRQQTGNESGDDESAKWQSLDENEKKRVAAEAYKAFEKQLADRRSSQERKPKEAQGGGGGGGARSPAAVNPGRKTMNVKSPERTSAGVPSDNPARTTMQQSQSDQVQMERRKHQEMVQQASRDQQQKKEGLEESKPKQSTEELRQQAAEASAKRAKKAEEAQVRVI